MRLYQVVMPSEIGRNYENFDGYAYTMEKIPDRSLGDFWNVFWNNSILNAENLPGLIYVPVTSENEHWRVATHQSLSPKQRLASIGHGHIIDRGFFTMGELEEAERTHGGDLKDMTAIA